MNPKTTQVRPAPSPAAPPVGFWALALFSGYLFAGAMGGTFFRMARDNDDLVRMCLLLVMGASLSFVLVRRGARLPLSLVLPALGFAVACFYSSLDTWNPVDSVKEFLKIGTYLLAFLTIAAVASSPLDQAGRGQRWFVGSLCLLAGLALGFLHTPPQPSKAGVYMLGAIAMAVAALRPASRLTNQQKLVFAGTGAGLLIALGIIDPQAPATLMTFRLWTTPQALASIGTTILCAVAFAAFIEAGTVRDSMVRGLAVLVGVSCAVGMMQFYGIRALIAWDPPQPYSIWVKGLLVDLVAPLTNGVYQQDPVSKESYLVLPRLLGIYGNPNFFMPFLMQFIPLTVAAAVLNPKRRWLSISATTLLMLNMGLTETAGGWYALLALSPALGVLFGWVSGPLPGSEQPALATRAYACGAAVAVFGGLLFVTRDIALPLFFISLGSLLGVAGWGAARLWHDRIARVAFRTILAGGVILAVLGSVLYSTGYKSDSLKQRGLKSLLALEMWRGAPLTTPRAPLTGIGLNAYRSWYPEIQQAVRLPHNIPFETLGSSFTQENRTHDDWLQLLCETGAIGTGMFVWLVFTLFAGALRRLRDDPGLSVTDRANMCGLIGCVAIILVYMVPNFPFHIVSSAATWWVIAGLLASYHAEWVLKRRDPAPAPAAPPFGGGWRAALEAAGAGTVLVVVWFSYQLFGGTLAYRHADDSWKMQQPPDWAKAARYYQDAVRLDPYNPQYAYEYAVLAYNNFGRDPALGAQAERLLEHARTLGYVIEGIEFGLGQRAEVRGDLRKALALYNRTAGIDERHQEARQGRLRIKLQPYPAFVATLDPRHAQFAKTRKLGEAILKTDPDNYAVLSILGKISVTMFHDYPAAVRYLKRACELVPNEPDFHFWYGFACALNGDLETSLKVLKRAAALNQSNRDTQSLLPQVTELLRRSREMAAKPGSPGPPGKTP